MKNKKSLNLPCLRGQVLDWIYYVCLMSYEEISDRFKPAEEIHSHTTLNELLQRALTRRSQEIGDYILNQKQHFFNAVIGGIYEGEPRWVSIELNDHKEGLAEEIKDSIGVMELRGDEKIFAIDGQHRVEGIKHAISKSKCHATEECAVIFVAHNGNKKGLERTRRLFSTLNRYAKPVKLGEIIALDEDDTIAIITRKLLYNHSVLKKSYVIAPTKTKNLPSSNKKSLTSIQALYELVENIIVKSHLRDSNMTPKKIREFKKFRKSEEEIQQYYVCASEWIDEIVNGFPEVNKYATQDNLSTEGFRGGEHGGFLMFRPIGFTILGKCIEVSSSANKRSFIKKLASVDTKLSSAPWDKFLYLKEKGTMRPRISKTDIALASQLWLAMAKLSHTMTIEEMAVNYAGATGLDQKDARKYLLDLGCNE